MYTFLFFIYVSVHLTSQCSWPHQNCEIGTHGWVAWCKLVWRSFEMLISYLVFVLRDSPDSSLWHRSRFTRHRELSWIPIIYFTLTGYIQNWMGHRSSFKRQFNYPLILAQLRDAGKPTLTGLYHSVSSFSSSPGLLVVHMYSRAHVELTELPGTINSQRSPQGWRWKAYSL